MSTSKQKIPKIKKTHVQILKDFEKVKVRGSKKPIETLTVINIEE